MPVSKQMFAYRLPRVKYDFQHQHSRWQQETILKTLVIISINIIN